MKLLITIVLFIFLTGLATYLIGSYFIRYALVPNNGAEDRILVSDDVVPNEAGSASIEQMTIKNQQQDEKLRDHWKIEMNLEASEVQIESHDGLQLVGHAFEQKEPTDTWVIAVHGYQSNEDETLLIGRHFYKAGYNVLTISLRAHGKSDGNYIGMGYLDKEDLIAWTHYLVAKNPTSQIIYHGTSMGGATVLMASGMDLPKNVKAVVSDCAYSNIWDVFASELQKRYNLPSFPILNMAHIMGVIHAGYDIKKGNVVDFIQRSVLPTLFIHTKPDDFVPVEMVYALYEAKNKGEKELFVLENGGHAEAKFVDPKSYYQRIATFLEQYL